MFIASKTLDNFSDQMTFPAMKKRSSIVNWTKLKNQLVVLNLRMQEHEDCLLNN